MGRLFTTGPGEDAGRARPAAERLRRGQENVSEPWFSRHETAFFRPPNARGVDSSHAATARESGGATNGLAAGAGAGPGGSRPRGRLPLTAGGLDHRAALRVQPPPARAGPTRARGGGLPAVLVVLGAGGAPDFHRRGRSRRGAPSPRDSRRVGPDGR